jgi:diguanylate cyclase (GGDEF)-like protein/PAS domain S-box-containing protein
MAAMTKARLWSSFVAVVLWGALMWAWVIIDLQKTYRRELQGAEQTGAILTRVLEGHMLSVTQKMNARLSEFVFYFQRDIAAGTHLEHIQAGLSRDLLFFPEVRGFQVTDAKGEPLFTDEGLYVPIYPDAADFFRQLRDNPDAGMVISPPLQSGLTGEWVIMFGRRLENSEGQFIGTAALVVRCQFFEDFARALELEEGSTIALLGQGQKLVAHLPPLPSGLETPLEDTAFATVLGFASEKEGSFIQTDRHDGVRRLFYFHNMKDAELPFVILFGQDERRILAEWRQRAVMYIVLCGAVTLILIVLMRHWWANYRRVENQARRLGRKIETRDREWRALLDSFPDPAWLIDLGGRYLAVNEMFCRRMGKKMAEVIDHTVPEVFPSKEDVALLEQGRQAVLEQKGLVEQIAWVHLENSAPLPIEIRRVPVFDEKGEVRALAGVGRNISFRYEMESRQQLFAQLFENNSEGIMILDAEEKITVVNPAFAGLVGYSEEEILGRHPGDFRSSRHDHEYLREVSQKLRSQGTWSDEIWLLHKNGQEIPVKCRVMSLIDQSKRTNWIVFMENLAERKASEAHINILSNADVLTGLPNRNSFARALEAHLERNSVSAMLTLDLDQLSRINDAYGHIVGDYLLRRISKRMRRLLRGQDVLGRLGDDQFGILIGDANPHGIDTVVRKLLGMVSRPVVVEGEQVRCTACVGICLIPSDGNNVETIMRNADAAMRYARSVGPGNYRFFSREMSVRLTERLRRENDLRNALERNELRLYYQPQVDIARGRIVGCEALLRWAHPEKGLVPPLDFIPLAEESGLILPIGKWVLEEACRQNKAWQDQGLPPIVMAVNISSVQFQDSQLIDNVVRTLENSGLEARWLELEITESVLMQDPEQVIETLEKLKTLDLRLSIDDFGTGYSSLAYLKRFPVDKIKIDRSFIQDLCTDADDGVIVRMVLGMARELCLLAIAEGVEDKEQLGFLMACQCHEYQGYLCSKPLPGEEFEALLKRGHDSGVVH